VYQQYFAQDLIVKNDGTLYVKTEKQGNNTLLLKVSTLSGYALFMPLAIQIGPPNVPRYNLAPRFDKEPRSQFYFVLEEDSSFEYIIPLSEAVDEAN